MTPDKARRFRFARVLFIQARPYLIDVVHDF